jgi:hypothetical protein
VVYPFYRGSGQVRVVELVHENGVVVSDRVDAELVANLNGTPVDECKEGT